MVTGVRKAGVEPRREVAVVFSSACQEQWVVGAENVVLKRRSVRRLFDGVIVLFCRSVV